MKLNDRIGERFTTNEGYVVEIIEYNKNSDVWVQFQDEHSAKVHTQYAACKKGNVKNPYHPSVYGVGCLGLLEDGNKPKTTKKGKNTREYTTWKTMLKRCYSDKYHEICPTYKDCVVYEHWLIFANFLEDLPLIEGYQFWLEHPNKRIALDKDIKGNGSKIYCLENCCFITCSDNAKERIDRCGNSFNNEEIKVYGINIKTGERTKDFDSITEACKELGIKSTGNTSQCINGQRKTSGGYRWFKVGDEYE